MGLSVLQARITVRWKRVLSFRCSPALLEFLVRIGEADAEGAA